jgi:hypothetical protein
VTELSGEERDRPRAWVLVAAVVALCAAFFVSGLGWDQPLLEQHSFRQIQTLGVVAGFAAVLVLALYINGETVVMLYRRPEVMWLTVPILLYWITRIWIKAHRGLMHDDPVLFALKDRVSILSGAMFVAVMWAAA